MTLLSRRKRRTTARRTTRATLAVKLAALVVLAATPALAQPPAGQPGGLPLPPGYRPRTPPPQYQPHRPAPTTWSQPTGGSGGTVMYFQKPADALTATGGSGSTSGGVAQLNDPGRGPIPLPVPNAAPSAALPPPPPPSRYLPPERPPALSIPAAAPTAYYPQPDPPPMPVDPMKPVTANKQELKEPPGGPAVTQLPPRDKIFMVYDDAQLEKAIIARAIQDIIETNAKKDPKDKKTPEELLKMQDARSLKFPPLPVISPAGVPYRPKTAAYEPRKVIIEPGYVVHRRLFFEEPNSERIGWDLGPMQTLVSAAYFWRDTLRVPHTLASGCLSGFWDTSAGKCMPGSTSPYYLYPPGLTLSGSAFEGLVITGGAFIFP